ncbi:MAG: hypothetical protein IKW39_03685 [Alphaproteobacteria bacterium]|nr:hypothetical protein [Alphaproteobacteria bacterium]
MLSLILSSLIITAAPNQSTEIIGSAATSNGKRHEITVTQPNNYIQLLNNENTSITPNSSPNTSPHKLSPNQTQTKLNLIETQTSTIFPKNMNPLDYQNKIENTIYQLDDRIIIIQSIPLKYIKKALTPNIQPTITDYPTL